MEKHEKLKILAETKLNTIRSYISKALQDVTVSNDEYLLILSQYEGFYIIKEEITVKTKKAVKEQKKGLKEAEHH